jgi:hypothetical protein
MAAIISGKIARLEAQPAAQPGETSISHLQFNVPHIIKDAQANQ